MRRVWREQAFSHTKNNPHPKAVLKQPRTGLFFEATFEAYPSLL